MRVVAINCDTLGTCDSVIVTMIRELNHCHYLSHHLNVQYPSIMFDIFIIALVLYMYDHAFVVHDQKLLITKTNTSQVLDM